MSDASLMLPRTARVSRAHDHERAGCARSGRYEPIIVTTLRRYVRRGASDRLLQRLAGSRRDWVRLNQTWNIDGTAELLPMGWTERPRLELDDERLVLGFGERRIALVQIVEECDRRGLQCPRPDQLARYFDCAPRVVLNDLRLIALSTSPAEKGAAASAAVAARVLS